MIYTILMKIEDKGVVDMEWREVEWIEDNNVLKLLGKNRLAFRDKGFMTEDKEHEIYVLVVGNGVIIQIHTCTYVAIIVKKKRFLLYKDELMNANQNQVMLYSIQETFSSMSEDKWIETMRKKVEKDF